MLLSIQIKAPGNPDVGGAVGTVGWPPMPVGTVGHSPVPRGWLTLPASPAALQDLPRWALSLNEALREVSDGLKMLCASYQQLLQALYKPG